MLDLINKSFSLGLGVALASKEQVEKMVDELVKKGEIKREESKELLHELMERGEKARVDLDKIIQARVQQVVKDLNIATMDEIKELEKKIESMNDKDKVTL